MVSIPSKPTKEKWSYWESYTSRNTTNVGWERQKWEEMKQKWPQGHSHRYGDQERRVGNGQEGLKGKALRHRVLFSCLETKCNLLCWVVNCLSTSNPFIPSISCLSEWGCLSYACSTTVFFISSLIGLWKERNVVPWATILRLSTTPDLDAEIWDLLTCYADEIWDLKFTL